MANGPIMKDIFVSYRRSDSSDVTGRIFDHMKERFGEDHLFKDVDSIPLGKDFRTVISEVVGQCEVLLAVIGKDWLKITGDDGRRRIDDPNDYVHIEIATALNRRIPVIPVLVENTSMPRSADLPEPLKDLAFRNGTPVRSDPDFHHDMDRLCSELAQYLPKGRTRRPAWAQGTKYGKLGAWAFGGIAVFVIGLFQERRDPREIDLPTLDGKTAYPPTAVRTYDDFGSSENNGAFDKSRWKLSDDQTGSMGYISQKDGRLTLARKELTDPKAEGGFDLVAREYDEIRVQAEMFFEATLMVDKRQDGHIAILLNSTAPTEPYSDCILGHGEDKAEMVCNYYGNGNDDDEAECGSQTLSAEYGLWHTVGIVIKPATMEFVYYADTENIGSCKPRSKEVFTNGKFTFQITIWGDSSKPVLGYIDEVKVGPWAKPSKSLSVVLERRARDGAGLWPCWVVLHSGRGAVLDQCGHAAAVAVIPVAFTWRSWNGG